MDDRATFDVILLNDIMSLQMLNLGTFLPDRPCFVCFIQPEP